MPLDCFSEGASDNHTIRQADRLQQSLTLIMTPLERCLVKPSGFAEDGASAYSRRRKRDAVETGDADLVVLRCEGRGWSRPD